MFSYLNEVNCSHVSNVGIIGEQMAGFNPFTLAPFGEDDEEENEESEQDERRYKTQLCFKLSFSLKFFFHRRCVKLLLENISFRTILSDVFR